MAKTFCTKSRTNRGQLGMLYLLLLLLAFCCIGAIALDTAHVAAVKSELHNATDAGALAGAAHLWFDIDKAEPDAIKFTAANKADGKSVSNSTPGCNVVVEVTAPKGATPGKVAVTAHMTTQHFFARLFGHDQDVVDARSVAGTTGLLWRIASNEAFPIAVSLDQVPSTKDFTGVPLNSCDIDDEFVLWLGAKGIKNAAFTSFTDKSANAAFIKSAIDQGLELSPKIDGFIPSFAVKDDLYLTEGILGQQGLAKEPYQTALINRVLVLPVIEGPPPYKQTRPCVGFIGLKVTKVKVNPDNGIVEGIVGTLCKPQVLGETGPYPIDGSWPTGPISRLSLGPIQLIE